MQTQQLPIEDNSNDILIDATMETNDKLADIAELSDVQAQGVMEINDELNELNRTAEMILEKVAEKKEINKEDVSKIIELLTQIKDKDFEVEISVNGAEIESITSETNEEED